MEDEEKEGKNEGDEGEASETKDVVGSEHRHIASMTIEAGDGHGGDLWPGAVVESIDVEPEAPRMKDMLF